MVKDILGVVVFLIVFSAIMFFAPEMNGYFLEANNFIQADPLKTPEHIAPVWYFTPYYAILRAIPPMFGSQFPGVLAMGVAVLILFFLPWLDRSPVKPIRYREPKYNIALTLFMISFIGLGWLGILPATELYIWNLAWMGEPAEAQRMRTGAAVILFLSLFFVVAFYLKKEFWRDVH